MPDLCLLAIEYAKCHAVRKGENIKFHNHDVTKRAKPFCRTSHVYVHTWYILLSHTQWKPIKRKKIYVSFFSPLCFKGGRVVEEGAFVTDAITISQISIRPLSVCGIAAAVGGRGRDLNVWNFSKHPTRKEREGGRVERCSEMLLLSRSWWLVVKPPPTPLMHRMLGGWLIFLCAIHPFSSSSPLPPPSTYKRPH